MIRESEGQYSVHDDEVYFTVTQAEAIAIGRKLAQEHKIEISIFEGDNQLRVKLIPHSDVVYVDYYLNEHIAQCDGIVHGNPRIAHTRIMVHTILDLLAEGVTIDEIISEVYYPDITREDVQACIAYASQVLQQEAIRPTP